MNEQTINDSINQNYKTDIASIDKIIENRQGTAGFDNLKFFFSCDYASVSNPFLINGFNLFIGKFNQLLKNEIIIRYSDTVKIYYCVCLLKRLFDFLKIKSSLIPVNNNENEEEFISIKNGVIIFEIRASVTTAKSVELIDNNYYWNINFNDWTVSIFKFALGLLYSFDETFDKEMLAYDLESTGLTPGDELTEIGALKIKNGVILKTFQTLVNPKRNIPRDIQQITNITNEMVRGAPEIKQAINMFADFAGEPQYIVVHNGSFDLAAIRHRMKKYLNLNFNPKVYDTRQLSQSIKPGSGLDLSSLSLDFDINLVNAHRALADAEATAKVFIKLVFLRNVKISVFFKDNLNLFFPLGLLENNITSDFRILMRAAAYLKNKLLKKIGYSLPLNVDEYYSLIELFKNISKDEINRLFAKKLEFIVNADINVAETYFDFENVVNLNISSINKKIAFAAANCFPFDDNRNKAFVFCSDTLSNIKVSGNKLSCIENGRRITFLISSNNFKFFENEKLYYSLKFKRYGLFHLFIRAVIIPLKTNQLKN